jgi:nucleotide-binding universal stress UspA family protein
MASPILLCADGSEISTHALSVGLSLLADPSDALVLTVVESEDPTLLTGTGFAGGTMSVEEFEASNRARQEAGSDTARTVAEELGLSPEAVIVRLGAPGPTVVEVAEELDARAVVMGTRGRGGVKRALLGSVSDYVIRHAPCPVVVTNRHDLD